MRLQPFQRLAYCAAIVLSLSSCANQAYNEFFFPHNVRHQVVFQEAEFANSLRSGSSAIRGRAYLIRNDDSRFYTAGIRILLIPVTAYTSEIIERKFAKGIYLAPPDPRMAKYARFTTTDAEGNFAFSNLPAGQYYVAGKVSWETTSTFVDNDGVFWDSPETRYRRIYAEATVGKGQTVTIDDWNYGPERIR